MSEIKPAGAPAAGREAGTAAGGGEGRAAREAAREAAMIRCAEVSKFYGDVLGVNRVTLEIGPGITSLVGPNGAGKTTLMNLFTGLIRPSQGRLEILGASPDRPEAFLDQVGYCAQYDSFPAGLSARAFVRQQLALRGWDRERAAAGAARALARVDLLAAADRPLAGFSKGMRQRARLAQALAHDPRLVILDEPLNGLDPLARAEAAALFRELARGEPGAPRCLVISSHILHEVEDLSDRVVLLQNGHIVAAGTVRGVREERREQAWQVMIRCDQPAALAARLFALGLVSAATVTAPAAGGEAPALLAATRAPDNFFLRLGELAASGETQLESVTPLDDNLAAVYQMLIAGGQA